MAYTNLLPRTYTATGANCTGVDSNPNRTLTLPDTGTLSTGISLVVNGTTLHEGVGLDFTISGSIITFLNPVWDVDNIQVNYFITFGVTTSTTLQTSTSLKYVTPLMFGEALGIIKDIPSWDVAGTPTNEAVGTGNGSTSTFYLDQKSVVSDTYYLYAAGTLMTETTHYTLDCDTGTITLTAAGITLLASTALTAKYKYYDNGMKDSYIISVLSRAEKEVDNDTNSTFTDGTVDNPAYPLEIEIQPSQGFYMNRWITKKKPVIDITSQLAQDLTAAATTLYLASGAGAEIFPTSGYIIIGSEIITYTGVNTTTDTLTGLSRGVLETTAAAHVTGDAVHSTIVLVSDTTEGTDESWTVQPWDTSMFVDENGLISRYKDATPDPLVRYDVANRFQIIYYYGYSIVPGDITRLTIIYAKRMLMQDNISKAIVAGRNEFRPEMFNADEGEVNRIVNSYIILPMGNT